MARAGAGLVWGHNSLVDSGTTAARYLIRVSLVEHGICHCDSARGSRTARKGFSNALVGGGFDLNWCGDCRREHIKCKIQIHDDHILLLLEQDLQGWCALSICCVPAI